MPCHRDENENIVPKKSTVQLELACGSEQDRRGGQCNEEDDNPFQAGFLRVMVTRWFELVRDHLHTQLCIAATHN